MIGDDIFNFIRYNISDLLFIKMLLIQVSSLELSPDGLVMLYRKIDIHIPINYSENHE